MRGIVTIVVLVAAGCAGQSVAPAGSNATATSPPNAKAPAVTNPADPSAPVPIADAIADAKKRGYTVVNQNGDEVVCRTQLRTGSRLQKDTYCFTPAEYEAMRRRTEQGLANTEMQTPPPQGK